MTKTKLAMCSSAMKPQDKTSLWSFKTCLIVVLGLLIHACARVIAPEGGPRDTIPPKLIKTYPEQGATGFRGKKIKLTFDKEIEARGLNNKLIVTPRLPQREDKKAYSYTIRGNTLTLTLEQPLEEDTTYVFNFHDAIRDVTESNAAKEPTLTFSTGDQVDSMCVAGKVWHLMTGLSAPRALVALHKADDRSAHILNSLPDYFVRTDERGQFELKNLKKGKYYLSASNSKEGALVADPAVDEYGFLRDLIDLTTTSAENLAIPVLKADIRQFELQRQDPQGQYFELGFNKPVADYSLVLEHKTKRLKESSALYSHLLEDKQVIRVYNTLGLIEDDSLKASLHVQDEQGQVIEETVSIHFRESKKQKCVVSCKVSPDSGSAIQPDFVGTITLNQPVKEILADRLFFVLNGQHTVCLSKEDLQLSDHRDVITIRKRLDPELLISLSEEGKHNEEVGLVFHIEKDAFVTVENGRNEASSRYVYKYRDPKELGTIQGQVAIQAPGFVVQLLDSAYKVIDEVRNEHSYQFCEVVPGHYKIRVLLLKAPDAAWDAGSISERREPDPVIHYPAEIGVIANWEIKGIDFLIAPS